MVFIDIPEFQKTVHFLHFFLVSSGLQECLSELPFSADDPVSQRLLRFSQCLRTTIACNQWNAGRIWKRNSSTTITSKYTMKKLISYKRFCQFNRVKPSMFGNVWRLNRYLHNSGVQYSLQLGICQLNLWHGSS